MQSLVSPILNYKDIHKRLKALCYVRFDSESCNRYETQNSNSKIRSLRTQKKCIKEKKKYRKELPEAIEHKPYAIQFKSSQIVNDTTISCIPNGGKYFLMPLKKVNILHKMKITREERKTTSILYPRHLGIVSWAIPRMKLFLICFSCSKKKKSLEEKSLEEKELVKIIQNK